MRDLTRPPAHGTVLMPRVSTWWQHLFTCELNTAELRNVSDCVERLKVLEETGRLWGQNMLLEVCGPTLLLTDIETKVGNESVQLRSNEFRSVGVNLTLLLFSEGAAENQ